MVAGSCDTRDSGPDDPAIDLAHLRRFTMGNLSVEAEVLQLFLQQVPKSIDDLRTAVDARAWQVAAHTLKGSARAVGAWRLAEYAEAAEKIDWLADAGGRKKILAKLVGAHQAVALFIAGEKVVLE